MQVNILEFVEQNAPELETPEVLENERDYLEFLEVNGYSKDDLTFLDYLQFCNYHKYA